MRVGGAAQKISFVVSFSFLVIIKKIRMRDRTTPSLVFTLSWKESSKSTPTRILRTWTLVTSIQDTSPTPAPPHPKNHWLHSPSSPSTRSSFLDNIQLYTKTAPKRRIPLQNHKLSFHHNHHNTHDHHLSCHFHLPHQHSNDQLNKYTRLHSLSLPYFQ